MTESRTADLSDALSVHDRIADALAIDGWGVFDDVLPIELLRALHIRATTRPNYRAAAVGRGNAHLVSHRVRRDETEWLTGMGAAEQGWLAWIESLRVHLNRTLMLGLSEFDGHFSRYPPGAFYRRHIDAFVGEGNRVVSAVAYLNPDWASGDGGELILYDMELAELKRLSPKLGTLVIYLSERFPHEVLPTARERFSLAGWFRRRGQRPLQSGTR